MIVGLHGYAGCGKDTAAQALVGVEGFERRAFADELKASLLEIDPIVACVIADDFLLGPNSVVNRMRLSTAVESVGWDEAKKLTEIRELLQRHGMMMRRVAGPNVWIDYVHQSMVPGVNYVITDVRIANEGEWVHRGGGIVVRITRPGVGPVNDHISDNDIVHCDYEVANDDTPEVLWDRIRELVK